MDQRKTSLHQFYLGMRQRADTQLGLAIMDEFSESEHIVHSFDEELARLDNLIAKMGGQAERLLGHGIDALERQDPELAEQTIHDDEDIDALEKQLEDLAILMIAKRQPMAQDLRQIIGAIRISNDLERVGDLGKNIAKRALATIGDGRPKQLMTGFRHMGQLALTQLSDVLDAYSERNAEKAVEVWKRDEELDGLYNSLFREVLTYMMEDPRNIGLCTHLMFGAKNIERIGDYTTNIAETVYYLVCGTALPNARPKGDVTSLSRFDEDDLDNIKPN